MVNYTKLPRHNLANSANEAIKIFFLHKRMNFHIIKQGEVLLRVFIFSEIYGRIVIIE